MQRNSLDVTRKRFYDVDSWARCLRYAYLFLVYCGLLGLLSVLRCAPAAETGDSWSTDLSLELVPFASDSGSHDLRAVLRNPTRHDFMIYKNVRLDILVATMDGVELTPIPLPIYTLKSVGWADFELLKPGEQRVSVVRPEEAFKLGCGRFRVKARYVGREARRLLCALSHAELPLPSATDVRRQGRPMEDRYWAGMVESKELVFQSHCTDEGADRRKSGVSPAIGDTHLSRGATRARVVVDPSTP